jgi:hypothetical protein
MARKRLGYKRQTSGCRVGGGGVDVMGRATVTAGRFVCMAHQPLPDVGPYATHTPRFPRRRLAEMCLLGTGSCLYRYLAYKGTGLILILDRRGIEVPIAWSYNQYTLSCSCPFCRALSVSIPGHTVEQQCNTTDAWEIFSSEAASRFQVQ